ncbi:LPXTG-site transpeptidase (sortase) family protein [Planomicrobium sp. HSC-17F08]|nr:LPXTG-site transpeptidase (sortase) family protein [Planomicrobium sp. HSC-17F08]
MPIRRDLLLKGASGTVFRDFGKFQIGDKFVVAMPYGEYTYEIRETRIVSSDDTTVVGKIGEEVLVLATCCKRKMSYKRNDLHLS